ncbi:MAG: hormogonium polysaccharide secretion pseudopilin HpsB [Aphanizomenon gracile PMC649.10]|nr:hormogonium polysaccharide secretion pseudopilin HpsB [Aphanizomenon gracile PMC649.10]
MMKPKPQRKNSSASDSGFTIIESLMAIVVVAILLAAIAPVLVMSTAVRVQSRRIEKATQAATAFTEGIKSGSISAPSIITVTAANSSVFRTVGSNQGDYLINSTQMPVPTSNTGLYYFQKTGIICKIGDSGCTQDSTKPFDEFYIQAAQIQVSGSNNPTNGAPVDGYRLAIRVYRSDVNFSQTLLASSKDSSGNTTKQADSPVTAGLGNQQKPSVERTVDIGSINTTFKALCSRLGMAKTNPIPTATPTSQTCQ